MPLHRLKRLCTGSSQLVRISAVFQKKSLNISPNANFGLFNFIVDLRQWFTNSRGYPSLKPTQVEVALFDFSLFHWCGTRTTDAQRGNSLHCTAENSIPIPNFQVRPKHILCATSAQFFRYLWFMPYIGCPQSVPSSIKG